MSNSRSERRGRRPSLLDTFFAPQEVETLPRKERFAQPNLKIFLGFYKPQWRLFLLDLIFATGIALINVAYPMISRHFLQDLLPHATVGVFVQLILILLGIFVFRAFLQYIVTYWGHFLGVRMETQMREMLFSHIQDLSFSFFDQTRTGHLLSRIVADLFDVVELAHHGPEDLLISTVTFIGSFIFMLKIRWELALLLLLFIPIVIYLSLQARRNMQIASKQVKETTADISASIESSISGAKVAQAFTNENYERSKLEGSNSHYKDAKGNFYRSMAIFQTGIEFTTGLLDVFVLGVGGIFVLQQKMDFVDLITFTLFVNNFTAPIRKLVAFFELYSSGMAGFDRFCELMRLDPEIQEKEDAVELTDPQGHIRFEHVYFSYDDKKHLDGREDDIVLEDLNLDIQPGTVVALVGPSGGGKSTLCQLIPRFYDVDRGRITMDGHDLRELKLRSLRQNIGIVQQEVFIFADTVKNNIAYGRLDATMEEIQAAAKAAEIHDFIMSLPEGYDTVIGERGSTLSGGQRQRIAIARVFLKDPAILLLDEATSALDTRTELSIQQSLDHLSHGRTTLIIAHRLSTIRDADEILYIEDGRVQERGTHDELMKKHGKYYALQSTQIEMAGSLPETSSAAAH